MSRDVAKIEQAVAQGVSDELRTFAPKKLKPSRGIYRCIYTALWDDPDFLHLNSAERLCLLNLRTSPLSNIPCLYRFYREAVVQQTGLTPKVIDRCLAVLIESGWIEVEDVLVWVKNGLKFDPSISLSNPKHLESIRKTALGLPHLKIIENFFTYYQIPYP